MLKKKANDDLSIIKNTIIDTKYILDDGKPCSGIRIVFGNWIKTFIICNLILFIYTEFSIYFNFFGTKQYYQIYRLSNIILLYIPFVLYQFFSCRVDMTVKEKDFLKSFMIFPLLISFFKTLNSISYYIDISAMVSLYDTIPFDLFVLFIAIYQVYRYFGDERFKYVLYLVFAFLGFFILIKYLAIKLLTINTIIANMNNFLDIVNTYSFFLIIVFGITTILIKEKSYE